MTKNETARQKYIREHLCPDETYASAESFYRNVDPAVQEILDANRLIEIGKKSKSEEELNIGKIRLRNAVIGVLDRPDAKHHPAYLHAYGQLGMVGSLFREDQKVQQIVEQYLGKH